MILIILGFMAEVRLEASIVMRLLLLISMTIVTMEDIRPIRNRRTHTTLTMGIRRVGIMIPILPTQTTVVLPVRMKKMTA